MQINLAELTSSKKLSPEEAQLVVRDCCCSDCWGHLIEYYDGKERLSTVRCTTEACPCNGFVHQNFVERRQAESRAELAEARDALREAVPWIVGERRSESQLLSELGYT